MCSLVFCAFVLSKTSLFLSNEFIILYKIFYSHFEFLIDEPDVKASYEFQSTRHGGDNKENVEQQSNKPKPFPAGYKTAVVYPMGHERRGTAVIFNIVKFEEKSLHDRTRSCNDVTFLERCFKALQFDVIIYESSEETQLTTEGLKQKLEDIRKSENDKTTDCDCFVCCILTYGQKGVIFCEDHDYYNTKPLGVDDIISNFKSQQCIKLAGRPKLFFIQADDPELLTMTAGFEDEVSVPPRKLPHSLFRMNRIYLFTCPIFQI
ncbi:hypothetical protein ScPMuIL_004080 [Solemya velum]